MKKVNSETSAAEKSQDKLISLGELSKEELKALLGGRGKPAGTTEGDPFSQLS